MSHDDTRDLTIEEIVDRCLDDVAIGGFSVEEALDRWPEHRDELAPLLDVAIAMRELPPVAERVPDPDRRAAFMASIATTPQDPPRAAARDARPGIAARLGRWFGGIAVAAPKFAAVAGPAAAIALVAVFVMFSGGADRASASTLTIFDGVVEEFEDGDWLPLADDASLEEGTHVRTNADGVALVTFPDGSTAALDPSTELVLERVASGESRQITLKQLAGRIWNDVAPGGGAASYVVRTPDAIVEAHGTTFETIVAAGTTEVVTASGEVAVAAGADRATVDPGLTLRASDQRIVDTTPHVSTARPATLRVDGPFVVSLQAENGAATGALPSGALYQQIPGVGTTDPGDGPQLLRFYDVAPGRYTLVIRRIDGPLTEGRATLENNGRRRSVDLPADLDTLRLQVDISVDGGIVSLALVDREATSVEPPVRDERIVDTPRTSDAVPVSDRRAAAAAQPTEATRPSATAATDQRQPTVTATRPPDAATAAPTAVDAPATREPTPEATATRSPPPTATPTDRPTAPATPTATTTPTDGAPRDSR